MFVEHDFMMFWAFILTIFTAIVAVLFLLWLVSIFWPTSWKLKKFDKKAKEIEKKPKQESIAEILNRIDKTLENQ